MNACCLAENSAHMQLHVQALHKTPHVPVQVRRRNSAESSCLTKLVFPYARKNDYR